MLVDGKKIKEEIQEDLKQKFTKTETTLAVVWVGDDPVIGNYIDQKKKFALAVGVELNVHSFPETITETALAEAIKSLATDQTVQGIIIQLPLPEGIEVEAILAQVPVEKDVDALSEHPLVLSPVVGAITEIFNRYQISLVEKKIVVIGAGRLVGRPIATWLAAQAADVTVLDRRVTNIASLTHNADVIITGIGQPGLLTPDLLKPGVVLIDAGTSESAGRVVGDALPSCADQAALFTPVPGGVGPIVLAKLFENLWKLSQSTK